MGGAAVGEDRQMGWAGTPIMDENLGIPGNLRRRGLGGILASMGTGMPTPGGVPRDPGMSGPAPTPTPAATMDPNEGAAPTVPLRDPEQGGESDEGDIPTYDYEGGTGAGKGDASGGFTPTAISHTSPHLQELEAEWQRRTHPSTGNRVLNLVGKLAPLAIGAATGGLGGAGAAALGVNKGELENRKFAQNDKDMLVREMEGERNRVERGAETTERANEMGQYHNDLAGIRRDSRSAAAATVTKMNPDGSTEIDQWDPATHRYDIPVGGGAPKGAPKARFSIKEQNGLPVVVDSTTGSAYIGNEKDIPPEAAKYLDAFNQRRQQYEKEGEDKEVRVAGRQESARQAAFERSLTLRSNKVWQPTMDAERRLAIMRDAEAHPNGQNDQALIYNHIGMTMSAQSGARMTRAQIDHAIQTRTLPQEAEAWLERTGLGQYLGQDPTKLPPGGFLTPIQRKQMLELGVQNYRVIHSGSKRMAEYMGMPGEPEISPFIKGMPGIMDVPSAQAQSAHKVGDTVRLRNGQSVTIKKVYPDGSFE